MTPINVPSVPAIYKVIAGIPLLIFAAIAIYHGWRGIILSLRMVQGDEALPRGSSRRFAVVGLAIWMVALVAGFGASWFFLALETAQPVIISQEGVSWVDGPLMYRHKFIPRSAVTKVTCNLPQRESNSNIVEECFPEQLVSGDHDCTGLR